MAVTRITLRNFRCFKQQTFDLAPGALTPGVTIIQGDNGSGKTSILEALHYGCHLRSFRTHVPAELYHDTAEISGFSIQISTTSDTLFIGVAGKKRVIKLNGTNVGLYNQLLKSYKVVTFIEDDLECIKGYPETRRSMMDSALSVQDPKYHTLLRSLRKIVDQRTKILQDYPFHKEHYDLWTDQLIETTSQIVGLRKNYLKLLTSSVAELIKLYDTTTESFLKISYKEKRIIETAQDREDLRNDELRAQRTLFGSHLDDIEFGVYERNSRSFASRGQQKLAMMFLKISQAQLLEDSNSILFLIDDFLTDFDEKRISALLGLLFKLKVQLVITTPQPHPLLYSLCSQQESFKLITIDSPDLTHIIGNYGKTGPIEISA